MNCTRCSLYNVPIRIAGVYQSKLRFLKSPFQSTHEWKPATLLSLKQHSNALPEYDCAKDCDFVRHWCSSMELYLWDTGDKLLSELSRYNTQHMVIQSRSLHLLSSRFLLLTFSFVLTYDGSNWRDRFTYRKVGSLRLYVLNSV